MTTHAMRHYPATTHPRWLVIGFVSGALSVLLFHQGAAALLHALELTASAPYSMQPTRPWGVPELWSIAFWGGIWGVLLAASLGHLDGAPLVVVSFVFGAVLPTLIAWLIVAPLKGEPMAAGAVAVAIGPIVNGAWGLGTGTGLALFGRARERSAA